MMVGASIQYIRSAIGGVDCNPVGGGQLDGLINIEPGPAGESDYRNRTALRGECRSPGYMFVGSYFTEGQAPRPGIQR